MRNMISDCLEADNGAWNPPPAGPELRRDEVHVWRASLDQPVLRVQQLAQTLSPDERRRAEGFCFERDKRRFIVRRGLLKMILSCYLDVEPSRLQLRYDLCGKPSVAAPSGGRVLCFSASHSHRLALYGAVWDREIGVDVERVHPVPEAEQIAARFFSAWENAVLRELPRSQKLQGFFNCWTRKEAFLKATGYGLSRPLDEFSVSLAPGEPARLMSVHGRPEGGLRWSLLELIPAVGYVAALCVEGRGWRLACWNWPTCQLETPPNDV
jgi:4'-phosphopantetheinyl transferase